MITFDSLKQGINCAIDKLSLNWLAIGSVVAIVAFTLLVQIFKEYDLSNAVIISIGVTGLINWGVIVALAYVKTYQFDRIISHANFLRLVYVLLMVTSIPCVLYLFYRESASYGFLEDFNETIINPFLNHSNFNFSKSLISLLGTIFLSGVLVSMLVSFINQRAKRWEKGGLYYDFQVSNYRAVIGGHDAAPSLVKQLLEKYNEKVIVFANRDIPSFRREVESNLQESQKEKVVFYHGYRNSKTDLKKLHLGRKNLKAIYILGESRVHGEEETSHDSLNMTCFDYIKELRGKDKTPIDCYVFFENQTTSIIFQKYTKLDMGDSLNFIPYNFYELHAQKAIGWDCINKNTLRLDRFGENKVNEDKHVHLVIIGMSRMGQALGLEAIRVCHYPNYAQAQMWHEYQQDGKAEEMMKNRRTRITFIDCNMKDELETFKCRYKRLLDEVSWKYIDGAKTNDYPFKPNEKKIIPDIEIEFVNGRIQSESVAEYLKEIANEPSAVMTVASCLSKSNQSIATILCLPKEVLSKAEIMVYQADSTELVNNISIRKVHKIKGFGKTSMAVDLRHLELLESMAKRINNVYVRKNIDEDEKMTIALSDFTRDAMQNYYKKKKNLCDEDWGKRDETWRWANRYHASAIWQKLHYIDNLDDIEKIVIQGITDNDGCVQEKFEGLMARVEHNRYCIEQWLLDRKVPSEPAFKNYISLNKDGDTDKKSGRKLTEFPTNDQVMTMAIPYIIDYSKESD